MTGFRSMGCDVKLPDGAPLDDVRAHFDARDRRFSRFHDSSELNRVNASPRGLALVSEEFASVLSLALDAARATPKSRSLTVPLYDTTTLDGDTSRWTTSSRTPSALRCSCA